MLKTKVITGGILLLVASCSISEPIIPNHMSELEQHKQEVDKKRNGVQSDFEIMKGWTEEERQYFIDHFVYKSIEIRNDTLIFVK
jgi:hypothetical protein